MIVLSGVVIGMVSIFILPVATAYFANAGRAALVDQTDLTLRRIGRDLSQALPNSTRITATGLSLELIPVTAAARYATESGTPLVFGVSTSSFSVIGPALSLVAGQRVAFYNLGASVPDADAYTLSNVRGVSNGTGAATTINLTSSTPLPVGLFAPPFRVYAINPPISYRCDLTAGTLTRYAGYGFQSTQPDPPSGGSSAVLARGVTACQFSYDTAVVASHNALVTMRLTLSGSTGTDTETVSVYHAVHVDNLP